MVTKIRWTAKANKDLDSIAEYLETEWNSRVKRNFFKLLTSKLDLISIFPNLGAQILHPKIIKSILITKHSRLYYRVNKNQIIILRIYDTRKDPKKFKLKL